MYVLRSLYLNFGHCTHHIFVVLHAVVFKFVIQFEIALIDLFLQIYAYASVCTSEFLRHRTISYIKHLRVFGKFYRMFETISSTYHWFVTVSNLFQHVAIGFKQQVFSIPSQFEHLTSGFKLVQPIS